MSAPGPCLVAAVGAAEGARAAAAALACAAADLRGAPLLVDLGGRPPRPTLLASEQARALQERLAAHLPEARVAARGRTCHLAVPADAGGFEAAAAAATVARGGLAAVHVPPPSLQALLRAPAAPTFATALLRADLGTDRAQLALLAADLRGRGIELAVLKGPLGWVASRRALFGVLGGPGGGLPARTLRRLGLEAPDE